MRIVLHPHMTHNFYVCFLSSTLLICPLTAQIGGISFTSSPLAHVNIKESSIDVNGNVYTIGNYRPSSVPEEILICKSDSTGNLVWQKTFSNSGFSLASTGIAINANSIYICGRGFSQSAPDYGLVARLDLDGNLIWERRLDTLLSPNFGDVTCDMNGGCIVSGGAVLSGNYCGIIASFDSSGNSLWSKSFNDPNQSAFGFGGVTTDASGNVYVMATGGYSQNILYTGILKFSGAGNLLWSNFFQDSVSDYVLTHPLIIDNVYVRGSYKNWTTGIYTMLLGKFDTSGNCSGLVVLGDSLVFRYAGSISSTIFNTLVVTGYTGTISNHHSYLMELDQNLNFIRGLENPAWHDLTDFTMDNSSHCSITGWSGNNTYQYHRGNSDYSWQWGCGFQSFSDSAQSIPITQLNTIIVSSNVPVATGFSTVTDIQISETLCNNPVGMVETSAQDMNVFPNPATGSVTLVIGQSRTTPETVFIYNSLGAIVYESNIPPATNRIEINIAGFSSGIYFVNLSSGEKTKLDIIIE